MPLLAAQSRHEKPYPPMSKIDCPPLLTEQFFGLPDPQNANRIPKSAPQRKAYFRKSAMVDCGSKRTLLGVVTSAMRSRQRRVKQREGE